MAQEYVIEPAAAKVEIVADLRELVEQTQAAVLADYRGLSVADLTALRKKLRAVDAEFRVVKNTLFKLAADGIMPVDKFEELLKGPTAISFAKSDPVGAAKVMVEFSKDKKSIKLKGGVMGDVVFNVAQVEELSKTPPREQLLSMMLGSLNAPITGLVGTLNGILSNFVFTLQAIVDKQSEPVDAEPAAA
ncbi:MAG: 50S ribosomal protein L10 [Capsulimonadaceae bacterium]